jgi:tetratricopeptide (TPR) repeat protein
MIVQTDSNPGSPRNVGSKRVNRIRITAILSIVVFASALAVWYLYRTHAVEHEYRPGETVAGVTRDLDRSDATGKLPEGAPEPRFEDVTQSAGLAGFRSFAGNRTSQLPEDMGGGIAWGDFDNDGDDDLFVVSAGGPLDANKAEFAPSMLFENRGDGTFRPHAGFPELRTRGMGAAWADVDNDGWLDLVVSGYRTLLLFRNRQGEFHRDATFPVPDGFWTGVSWGDYDRDGLTDLYVCGYVRYQFDDSQRGRETQQFGQAVPHTLNPSSYEPERNLLLRNLGNGKFTEVARAQGVDNPTGRSLSGLWHDFDQNGWQDLYVANDISESKLYLNFNGKFQDAGRTSWVGEYRGSMGLAAGDFDRDGDDDLFISHWIAQQFALYESLLMQQGAQTPDNSSAPELHFTDVAEMRGIGQPTLRSIGWGAEFADIDSDGWPDLLVAAGSTFEAQTSPKSLVGMPSFLFWNASGEFFQNLALWSKPFNDQHVSRGLAVSDYDNDGDLDLAVVDLNGGVRLLRNSTKQGNSLRLRLRGLAARPWTGADGAQVTAWVGMIPHRRTVSSSSYLSQSSRNVHIGLGSAAKVDRVEIRWPDGHKEQHGPLDAGVLWMVERGRAPVRTDESRLSRDAERAFWQKHRAAMDALKRDNNHAAAATLFREALAIHPAHEDARYYLANSLVALGDPDGAVRELDVLLAASAHSLRALQRKGELLAIGASSREGLRAALPSLREALRLNSEETGTLMLLGEVLLAIGEYGAAEQHLAHVCQANPRAAEAWFLRGYIAWKRGNASTARKCLDAAKHAFGPEWKPEGAVLEGDVKAKMYQQPGLLRHFAREWRSSTDPVVAFAALDRRLLALR